MGLREGCPESRYLCDIIDHVIPYPTVYMFSQYPPGSKATCSKKDNAIYNIFISLNILFKSAMFT